MFVWNCTTFIKGTVPRDFCFWFFHESVLPPPPAAEYSVKTISNFFENSRRYSQFKVHHWYQRHRWQICLQCQWRRWQFATSFNDTGAVANNRSNYQTADILKWTWKKYLYANSTSQRCPKENIKIFLIIDFFHLPPVSLTPVANLELRISPWIFEKIRNGLNGLIRGLGETDSWKNQKQKISWHCPCPFNISFGAFSEVFFYV